MSQLPPPSEHSMHMPKHLCSDCTQFPTCSQHPHKMLRRRSTAVRAELLQQEEGSYWTEINCPETACNICLAVAICLLN